MLEEKDAAVPAPVDAMRDEEGALRAEFVAHVAQAVAEDDPAALHGLVGDLHAADLGDAIEACDLACGIVIEVLLDIAHEPVGNKQTTRGNQE